MVASCISQISLRCNIKKVGLAKSCPMMGSQSGLKVNRGAAVVTMLKKDIHPEFYPESKVFCNGEEVTALGGTQESYNVDIWSGNHPFFKGETGTFITDEGRVNRFNRRFGGLALGKIVGRDKDEKKEEK
mmetsp:Transcript_36530/g.50731  ORF Transcript_36530/g.50731 Transcript_36530/m.50731 type:complete len:130 (+) Transcript_36530:76-465(+)|eukprot:CAMPEP_0196573758 /NCGR_PEP_ID=MMETSP1081-20130531/3604_1 /TAXON_ID=36882 /ORGANISM="Pyramimonas amylifera, Strain CCMP720" /LENGTH=129 /DNA_ID=CAMNT_0041891583 /DNA_START=76 /DNA_END=465 /DNA_ORIENTATION=+